MRWHSQGLAVFILVLAVVVAACGGGTTAPAPETDRSTPDTPGTLTDRQDQDNEMTRLAERAARLAKEKDGVRDASAVMTAPEMLVVGLFLESDVDEQEVQNIERELTEEIPEKLDEIEKVTVSANPDVAERIRDIGRGIAEGRPLSQFKQEMEEINNRIMPRTTS